MELQKLKNQNATYISCNLLNSGEGVDGLVNVETVKAEYGSTAKTFFTSNISYNEKSGNYRLEEFNKSELSPVLIEEDMFKNQKVWIKEGAYAEYIIEKLKTDKVLSLSLKEDILNDGIEKFYKDNHLSISLLNGIPKENKKEIFENISPKIMLEEFVKISENYNPKILSSSGSIELTFVENDLTKIKDKYQNNLMMKISTKKLLAEKASSLNELIEDSSVQKRRKNKPI